MIQEYKRVFAALDGGDTQNEVALRALRIAEANKAHLVLGHVVDSLPYESGGVDYDSLVREVSQAFEENLDEVLTAARLSEYISKVQICVKAGRIGETLIEQMIEPFSPDLVICGERGLSNITYAFVGSVSKHLIHNTSCDVLVVKHKVSTP